ncbi:MAG: siroheme decarboxylase subunit beta [Betaproteobacteria bacterium]
MKAVELELLDGFQRDFPLCSRPYAVVGEQLGMTEAQAIVALRRLQSRGWVSRIGATFVPGCIGAATLAAMRVPHERLEAVARLVNGYREVNHNYEREHEFNLWFVITAPTREQVQAVVRDIERRAHCGHVLDLPMIETYRVDLGFKLQSGNLVPREAAVPYPSTPAPYALSPSQRDILTVLQDGLSFTARPFAELAGRCGMTEREALAGLEALVRERVIARFGVIVRHRPLGYRANAMVVWDVPNSEVQRAGAELARARSVTLAYRRQRFLSHWRYNLYCMIHGTDRGDVQARIAQLAEEARLEQCPSAVLFSRRCFKQRGARYVERASEGLAGGSAWMRSIG